MAPFENFGPAADLLRTFKSGRRPGLCKALASFMAVQMLKSPWPLPDVITYIPQPFLRSLELSYNPARLLAQELCRMTERPLASFLQARSLRVCQDSLPYQDRLLLSRKSFQIKKSEAIAGKKILLIDDKIVSGATMRQAARTLFEGFPLEVRALAFAIDTQSLV